MRSAAALLLLITACASSRDRVGAPPMPDAGTPADAGQIDAPPVSGARAETPPGIRHVYAQVQAWTTDGAYFMGIDLATDEAVVFDARTWAVKARVGRFGHRWINGTHAVLMFEDDRGSGAKLYAFDVEAGQERLLVDLGHPGLRSGRSQEETDRAGRYVAVYIDEATSGGPRIVTADLQSGSVAADVSIEEIGCEYEPDWVGVDPTGEYLLVQAVGDGNGPCMGLWAHDIRTGAPVRQLTEHHNHGSMGLGPDGRPYFLSTELAHPRDNGSPGIFRYWIDTGDREVVGPPLPWGALEHVSCLDGPGAPCVASASNEFATEYTGQVWRLDFDGTRAILEPHHANGCDYWGQPQATAGPGGRYAFATHGGDCARIRSVVVQ